ncbi:PREDICTED: protein FAM162A-like isoform X2 [Haliaeetus leucocephalus]|uniref:protein FAM162A-like isoform X2 n=1 Tax=Haliaeetus leucocephalus TaxID=52644 RepID=UPI00053CB05B|nr:PREDICTED: protein FAM162A-like isoform X2 [Haliaeetus leucocephalus]
MLGGLLGRSPGLWRWVVRPALHPARAVGDKVKGARDEALETANPGYKPFKNDRKPTNFDKKVLVWAGRFKKEEDIPKHISTEVLDAARNSIRIKVCYIMIALTLLGCLAMVITGKEISRAKQRCEVGQAPLRVLRQIVKDEQASLARDGKISSDSAEANNRGCLGTRVLVDGPETGH